MVAYTTELTSHMEYKKVCMNDEIVIFFKSIPHHCRSIWPVLQDDFFTPYYF